MAFNDLVAQKIKDFEQQGVPQVFERDLDLGNPQEPKRDNIVHVIVGTRRCGKTYRLYQEMRRLQDQGIELDRMLYFNFEDERLRPYKQYPWRELAEKNMMTNPMMNSRSVWAVSEQNIRATTEMEHDGDHRLRRLVPHRPGRSHPLARMERPMSWAGRRRLAACAAALAALVAIAEGLTGCAPPVWLTHHADADANGAGAGGTGNGTFSDWPPYEIGRAHV